MNSAGGVVDSSVAGARRSLAARQASIQLLPAASRKVAELPRICSWRLTQVISRNAQITLYRARPIHDLLGPGCYSIKTLTAGQTDGSLALARLYREARVAAEVSHPHISSVLAANWNDTEPHLALPYFDGVSLRQLLNGLARRPTLPPPIGFGLCIARQLASALGALHEAGWLHSQVRPEHVIISPRGHATLVDLTLARRLDSAECDSDETSGNSPCYAAPEEFLPCARLTAAADLYSLGILLYETLTGQRPFTATQPKRLAMCHRREAPPDLRQLCPLASRETNELVRRMLAKEPLRRPSAAEVVRWLAELGNRGTVLVIQNRTG